MRSGAPAAHDVSHTFATGGEVSTHGERSEAGCVGARFIAPWVGWATLRHLAAPHSSLCGVSQGEVFWGEREVVTRRGGSGVEWGGDPCSRPRPLPTPFLEKTSL